MNLRRERGARAREDHRRDEELRLLREQVEGEAEDRQSERRAELICRQGERGGVSSGIDRYTVAILNGGKATAHQTRAWIADESGEPLSLDTQHPGALAAGELSPSFTLGLRHEHSRDRSVRIFLRCAWIDGTGENEENISELEHI